VHLGFSEWCAPNWSFSTKRLGLVGVRNYASIIGLTMEDAVPNDCSIA